jgi:hypothetical protein
VAGEQAILEGDFLSRSRDDDGRACEALQGSVPVSFKVLHAHAGEIEQVINPRRAGCSVGLGKNAMVIPNPPKPKQVKKALKALIDRRGTESDILAYIQEVSTGFGGVGVGAGGNRNDRGAANLIAANLESSLQIAMERKSPTAKKYRTSRAVGCAKASQPGQQKKAPRLVWGRLSYGLH